VMDAMERNEVRDGVKGEKEETYDSGLVKDFIDHVVSYTAERSVLI